MSRSPNILVYRNMLLNASETFIKEQTESLRQFIPYYAGLRLKGEIPLPADRTLFLSKGSLFGKVKERVAQTYGFPCSFVRKVRHLNPMLVHSHFGQDAAVVLPLVEQLSLPLIVTFHGFDITTRDECADSSLTQRIYFQRRSALRKKAALFIAVSRFIQKHLIEKGFPEEKIRLHYIGVDTQYFSPQRLPAEGNVVLFVGRLVEKKGCQYLIDAVSRIQNHLPDLQLVVIGDGPLRSSLETIASRKLRNALFLGWQTHEAVRAWMQKARVFCVPSHTARSGDSEGFGIVFAEAQAVGLPVVSFASGGVPEAVAHAETGLLAPEGNLDELAGHLFRLLSDQELWQSFSHRGRDRICRLFDLQSQSSRLEELYAGQALQGKPIYDHDHDHERVHSVI